MGRRTWCEIVQVVQDLEIEALNQHLYGLSMIDYKARNVQDQQLFYEAST